MPATRKRKATSAKTGPEPSKKAKTAAKTKTTPAKKAKTKTTSKKKTKAAVKVITLQAEAFVDSFCVLYFTKFEYKYNVIYV